MRVKAIIHLGLLMENVRSVQRRIGPDCRICIPVKADGYGHGALQIARAGLEAGAFCFAVAGVDEGKELRDGGIKAPVLLLSQPHPEEIPDVIKAFLTPLVSDYEFAGALNTEAGAAGIRLPVHLKIDTGMGRMGCSPEDAPGLARFIAGSPALEYAGTATHLAVAESAAQDDIVYTRRQIECFNKALAAIRAQGVKPGIVHAANSGAVLLHPEAWFDMVRPGILLYGYGQINEEDTLPGLSPKPINVKPVMELRSCVVLIKKVKKGESLSYGRTWTALADTTAAILSIGYADGLPRAASNKWQVVIRGKTYPLVGRICMDLCIADLGPETEVCRWDEAIIFGGCAQGAAALAENAGTVHYEVICNVNKRVPRIYEG